VVLLHHLLGQMCPFPLSQPLTTLILMTVTVNFFAPIVGFQNIFVHEDILLDLPTPKQH
jgi:hypothetical protein